MSQDLELINIQVGKKFPLFTESVDKLKGVDGAFFEASSLDQGYMFCIHLTNIGFMEKESFRKEKITVKILQGDNNLVLPMIRFGKSMMFEMFFDPTLYDDDRVFQFTGTNNMLSLFLIESNTGELKAIRQCNLPLKMIQMCKESWSRAILDIDFSERFNEWTNRLKGYPLDALWSRASKVGEMGESYNLQDILIPSQVCNKKFI